MDNINGLPDDLLVKILSFVPTYVAVSTCVLSKRWEFLWMWLPNLEFVSPWDSRPGIVDFINKKLPIHRAPVIERLCIHINSNPHIKPEYIKRWIEIAVSHYVRELQIDYHSKTKITLQLEAESYFIDGKYLQQLISGCPVLEDLSLRFCCNDNLREFTVIIPSLQSLSLFLFGNSNLNRYKIDTPSLKYLKLEDWNDPEHYSWTNMPKLREAYVDVESSNHLKTLIGSITSVKHLTICCLEDYLYGDGFIFNHLEHLKLCMCPFDSSNLLGQLLKGSPNLQVLDIFEMKRNDIVCWNQPSSVLECLLSSLKILNWSAYFGRPQDRDIAVYILKNACHLKTATFLTDKRINDVRRLKMIKELRLSPRASSTCQLVFGEDF
ncbi:F-box/RNI-like superfamily protein [Arabidopsis thaliana]|uniref:Putative FBD-associated F-box protein At5g38570 n=1 Tax=Arabidopsis thaliana TaxID=3702 RepID=FBD16_ARATH|nr:F-box/RNI-like superfamily protein [Arabidopsis thaliana]Q9FFW4.2 RecName: Full=Putative FBD-associated F-box protein At5g38570 [Arabidopsis thaliana]AED94336.1 F-box/RNI-like superfamily protein [Arabidopsis thaliana]|eukprot:NP_198673.2 F-box/RNI-like superfamily protein [Arabidopsis thaliana]